MLLALALWVGYARFAAERAAAGGLAVHDGGLLGPAAGAESHEAAGDAPDAAGRAEESPAAPLQVPVADVTVHVTGAVARPGVYLVPDGSRVADAIAAAGGAADLGVADSLNLAARVADGDKVFVPTAAELGRWARSGPPALAAGAQHVPYAAAAAPASGGGGAAGGGSAPGRINVNQADAAALEALPGVGPALARRIVEERTRRGRFSSLDDLTEVPGIGEKKLEQMRAYLSV